MTMRVNTIVTHFGPEEVYALIEFLDQLRAVLMQTYGDEIMSMLQEASQQESAERETKDEPF